MTPREATARALARHVSENDEQFDHWVDTFSEDLKEAGYEVAGRALTPKQLAQRMAVVAATDPLIFLTLKERQARARQAALTEEHQTLAEYRRAGGATKPIPEPPDEPREDE